MTKDEIRIHQKKIRNGLIKEERDGLCEAIRDRLFQTEAYSTCNCIFPFVSFDSEVDTKEIIKQSIADGKRVYIPRVEEKNIEFYEIDCLEGLILSKFKIPEPPKDEMKRYRYPLDSMEKNEITEKNETNYIELHMDNQPSNEPSNKTSLFNKVMLLPGLAFDRSGNRIGYGAGFYDRYLSTHLDTCFYKIAVAFDFQIVDNITADEFDVKVDAILTPTEFIICS